MLQSKYFRTCLGIIFALLIIYLGTKVSFIFKPIVLLVNIMIIPVMLAGFMYYLLRPLVNFLAKHRWPRPISILLIYLVFAGLIVLFSISIWPTLREQLINFANNAPHFVQDLQRQFEKLQQNSQLSKILPSESELTSKIIQYLNKLIASVTNSISNAIAVISNVLVIFATVPIVLYYMLKESSKLIPSLLHFLPRKYRKEGQEALLEIDSAISNFIVGRVVLNIILGVLMYIGFLIIGLPYSMLLAFISIFLNFIPYVGAFLAGIPIVIVGFIDSPSTALWSLVVILVAQQVQDNLLAPYIYGKSLEIHPLTTIVLLLIGGGIAGIIGVLLAIPVYMIAKIIFVRIYKLFLSEKMET
ncbi:AI-2E family transporter [Paenibacillus sp. KQZ6P-2]|uniref:AI-2E family transporter n=1 Tax=Paenibacillus mangrovi TaxID=2931978 RepID=A0A9X1WT77_9BACL|nr:AI-2E family transporter [Paenibacillus mangrovi]MCJ8011329.1 AI-2E family transporter [Paenibacillus mangrovi]